MQNFSVPDAGVDAGVMRGLRSYELCLVGRRGEVAESLWQVPFVPY